MDPSSSGLPESRLRHAAVAAIVAIVAAAFISQLGYSQQSPKPAAATKASPAARGAPKANTAGAAKTPATIDYETEVHAILADHCLACHNAEKRSDGLSLGTYEDIMAGGKDGAVVKPGSSGQSLLVRRIMGEVTPAMPFGGDPLSPAEIATLRKWIDEGARSAPTAAMGKARWEPPLTLTEPAVPAPTWADWTQPLDRFTSAYLAKQGVAEPVPVDEAEFARRAYLDVWGLLPTPEEIRDYIDSKDPDKRTKLVASLMDNPTRYAENWISYWNDLLRNDEGVAYFSETAQRKSITPWLLDALEKNKPYNQMARELLDPRGATDPDGFLIGVNWRGTTSASQTPAMQASQNTAQIFLGINFKCNSCHDSFISKWKLKDSYALAAYFSKEDKLQLYRCDIAQPGQFATAAYMYPELNRPLPSNDATDRRAAIADIFTDPRNGRFPRTLVNRMWEKLMGRGIVENVDDMDGEPWSPELLDYLSSDFVKSGYDIRHLIATIVSSNTYEMKAVPRPGGPPKVYAFRGPELRRLTAEEFADAVASVTGDWRVGRPLPRSGTANTPNTPAGGGNANTPAGGAQANGAPNVPGVFSGAPIDTAENLAINTRGRGGAANAPANGVAPNATTGGTSNGPPEATTTGAAANAAGPGRGRGGAANGTAQGPARAGGGRGAAAGAQTNIAAGLYSREWRIAGDGLTHALGRPIRDQVYTTRDSMATTMQAVELVNGETLNHWLWRGAERMLGELPPEPVALFGRQVSGVGRPSATPAAPAATVTANTTGTANAAGAAAPGASTPGAANTAPPIPESPAVKAYAEWMTAINAADAPLRAAIQAKDVAASATEAGKMIEPFDQVLGYWMGKNIADPMGFAQSARDAARAIASAKDFNTQNTAMVALSRTCIQCHTGYRAQNGPGKFAISPIVLTAPPIPPVPFSIDVSKLQQLYLIVEDNLSTVPEKATPVWLNAYFTSADGKKTPLSSLRPMETAGLRDDATPVVPQGLPETVTDAVRVKFPSVLIYDISNRGFTKFNGTPTYESISMGQGESINGRFFVFDQKPTMDRLATPSPETPVAPEPPLKTSDEAVDRVYWYLLGRAPTPAERQVAMAALRDPAHPDRPTPAALADLLWSVMLTPEFQFIR